MAGKLTSPLYSTLLKVRDRLRETGHRLVLAESCTAGMVAAELGQIPGISEFLCGSMVVYRTPTKIAWLDISPVDLADKAIGPVSARVTQSLALALLNRTPEATIAAAITGHLGPNAPPGWDGVVFCAVSGRTTRSDEMLLRRFALQSPCATSAADTARRRERQSEAAYALLGLIGEYLASESRLPIIVDENR